MVKKGIILMRDGKRLSLLYSLGAPAPDQVCYGTLLGDFDEIDPWALTGSTKLVCEDGRVIDLLVTHLASKAATFVGSLAPIPLHEAPGIPLMTANRTVMADNEQAMPARSGTVPDLPGSGPSCRREVDGG